MIETINKAQQKTAELWQSLNEQDAVCFDVDSTVVTGEFIDELAAYLGVGELVQNVTKNAMGGKMNFRTALHQRLSIMQPSLTDVNLFSKSDPLSLTNGIKRLVDLLHSLNIDVYLVSGGFDALIFPVAEVLNIPLSNVFANTLLFTEDGKYKGFDEEKPTSDSGGKGKAIASILTRKQYRHVVMIGDGATDAEASPPADAFIGFGGNVTREAVKSKCDLYIYDFDELTKLLRQNSTEYSIEQPTLGETNSCSNGSVRKTTHSISNCDQNIVDGVR